MLVLAGCTHKVSLEHIDKLQPGKTSADRALALFGEPYDTSRRTTPAGSYVHAQYQHVREGFAGHCMRRLQLEFLDGVLNGFLSASSCEEEKTTADVQGAVELGNQLGLAAKGDVRKRMGEPSGELLCPTVLEPDERPCDEGARELWFWMTAPAPTPIGEEPQPLVAICAAFDGDGLLMDIQSVEE